MFFFYKIVEQLINEMVNKIKTIILLVLLSNKIEANSAFDI